MRINKEQKMVNKKLDPAVEAYEAEKLEKQQEREERKARDVARRKQRGNRHHQWQSDLDL